MLRNVVISLTALLLWPWGMATAEKLYKWVDPQGNVSYRDRPPPQESGYRVEEKQLRSNTSGDTGKGEDVSAKAPVVLYTIPKCSACDAARAYLQKRKAPFTEKNAENNLKVQEELKAKTGTISVPTILVGSKVMTDFMESLLGGELDAAGYPKPEAEKPADDQGYKAPTK